MKKIILSLFVTSVVIGQSIEISKTKVNVGDVIEVKVFSTSERNISIGKSVFPVYPVDKAEYKRVIIGIPSWWDAGEYKLSLKGIDSGVSFEIVKKDFPSESIKIAPEKVQDSEETKDQRERIFNRICTKSIKQLWTGRFIVPVKGRVSTKYGTGRTVNNKKSSSHHKGIDISADLGASVKSANNGTVVLTGEYILTGKTVIIDHGQGIVSAYYHLSEIIVKEGADVKSGEVIAKVGSTGMSTGPHLHWGIYIFGVDVDPMNFVDNDF